MVVDGEFVYVAEVVLDEGDDACADEGRGDGAEDEGLGTVVFFWLQVGEGDLGVVSICCFCVRRCNVHKV